MGKTAHKLGIFYVLENGTWIYSGYNVHFTGFIESLLSELGLLIIYFRNVREIGAF